MENIKEFFQTLARDLQKKNVTTYCNKLSKRKTLNTENAVDELCDLCVWLYVYEAYEEIVRCAAPTHDFPIPEIYFASKDGSKFYHLYDLWGMEIRALRRLGQTERADEIRRETDHIQLTLRSDNIAGFVESPADTVAVENKRRNRIDFDELSNEKFLALAGKPIAEQGGYSIYKNDIPFYRMRGIRSLVGGVEAGVYPNLDIERSEDAITRYADALRRLP
jgi:hypothetical protein